MSIDRFLDADFLFSRWLGGADSPAARWLDANAGMRLGIPWTAKGEFFRTAVQAGLETSLLAPTLARYPAVWPDEETVEVYAQLRKDFAPEPDNSLWTAACAVRWNVPLVTRRFDPTSTIPGFTVEKY